MGKSLTEMNSWILLGQTYIKSTDDNSKLVLLATFWTEPKAKDLIPLVDDYKNKYYELHLVKTTSLHTSG